MTPNIFLISDTHFGQESVLNFTRDDGSKLRDFASLEEMHVHMAEKWNSVVGPKDKIYHLGDVAFTKDGLRLLHMLNGKKRLIRGNHDRFALNDYREHFEEVYGVRQLEGYWLTHVPMHPSCLMGRAKLNVHGHIHARTIDDDRYFNVSVENVNYTPIHLEEIIKRTT